MSRGQVTESNTTTIIVVVSHRPTHYYEVIPFANAFSIFGASALPWCHPMLKCVFILLK
jgi:hypothetical protein